MDFTRFQIRIAGETHDSMSKRYAIHLICMRLVQSGVAPEEITGLFEWRPSRVWYVVDGNVDSQEFIKRASTQAEAEGRRFDRRRWLLEDDELAHANGKTYAFSSQWGGKYWLRAMDLLKERYEKCEIGYSPMSTTTD